jgi:hypothetical protein
VANILNLITVGEKEIYVVDALPGSGGGTASPVGSLAMYDDGSGNGYLFVKTGSSDTAWDQVSTTATSGIINAGVAGRLTLYPSSGNAVDDIYVQNGQNISVAIANQPSRSAAITYNIPNPGDAVTSADFVLTEGAQTINGDKTFGDDVIINGDLTVNGSLTYLNTTNTNVTDKLITLNKGGAAASAGGSGLEFEENAVITGYLKQAPGRDGYVIKPSNAFELDWSWANLTADREQKLADTNGTFVMRPDATPGVAGQISYWNDANNLVSEANLFWDASNDRLGIGTNAPSTNLHVVGGARISALSAGVVHSDANGNLSVSAVLLGSEVSGILPIANGGTNSSTALNNNRIMVSSAGAIVEHSALTAGSVIFADSNGLPGQDNANFFWNNTTKRLGIGTTAPNRKLQIVSDDASVSGGDGITINYYNSSATAPVFITGGKARGTISSPTAIQSGDQLYAIAANGHDGTSFQSSPTGVALFIATENFTPTSVGTKFRIATTPNGSSVAGRRTRFEIDQDGGMILYGNTSGNIKFLPAAVTTNYSVTLPSAQGAANTFMRNDGSGNLSWNKVDLTTDISGVLPIANGGTNSSAALNNNRIMVSSSGAIIEHSALTAGSVLFANANGLPGENNANFFWDSANARLGLGTNAPTRLLDVNGSAIVRSAFRIASSVATKANFEIFQDEVSTTNATVTTLSTIAIPTDSVVIIEARVAARRTGGTGGSAQDSAAYVRTARFKNVAGTVTIQNLQSDYTSEDQNSWNCTLDVNGTDARIRVNGAANNNVDWTVTYSVVIL